MTSPVNLSSIIEGLEFVTMLTILFCFPVLSALLNSTRISPPWPGSIGVFGQSFATVHPQGACTFANSNGASPRLINENEWVMRLPATMVPKLNSK